MISAQADRAHLVDGDHDPHPVLEDAEDVERLALAGDLGVLDAHHLAHALAGIHGLVARLEAGLHLGAASSRPGTPPIPRTYHGFGLSATRRLDLPTRPTRLSAFLSGRPRPDGEMRGFAVGPQAAGPVLGGVGGTMRCWTWKDVGSVRSSSPCSRSVSAARSRLPLRTRLGARSAWRPACVRRRSPCAPAPERTSRCSRPPVSRARRSPAPRRGRRRLPTGRPVLLEGRLAAVEVDGRGGRAVLEVARVDERPGEGADPPVVERPERCIPGPGSASCCAPSSAPTPDPRRGGRPTPAPPRAPAACPPRAGCCPARWCRCRRRRGGRRRVTEQREAFGRWARGRLGDADAGGARRGARRRAAARSSAPAGRTASPGADSPTC